MIIGISMGQETCLIRGHVQSIYSVGRKNSRRIYVVRGEINEKTADIQARSIWPEIWKTMGKNAKLKD